MCNTPEDKSYLECDLPPYLRESLDRMIKLWELHDAGYKDNSISDWWCDLQSSINIAEVEQEISSVAANYLRKKYLRLVDM